MNLQVGSKVKFKPWDEWEDKHGIDKRVFESRISYDKVYRISSINHRTDSGRIIFSVEDGLFGYTDALVYQDEFKLPEELFEI